MVETVYRGAIIELFPGAQGAVVVSVDDDAETLVGCDADVETDEEEGEDEEAVPAG